MKSIILDEFIKHIAVSTKTMQSMTGLIEIAANICINSLKNGNKILLIGNGGREHAICIALKKSKKIEEIYCFPGNAGTEKIAKNIALNLEDFDQLKNCVLKNKIDLVIVGPEKPLVDGIVDFLEKNKIKVFGPNQMSAQLEGSKIFTKNLCKKYKIPTAKFGVFTSKERSIIFIGSLLCHL